MTTCGLLYEKNDSPWTYRCVLDKGHSGECDPRLVPPPRLEEPPQAEPPPLGCPNCGAPESRWRVMIPGGGLACDVCDAVIPPELVEATRATATATAESPSYRVAEQVFRIAMRHSGGRLWSWDEVPFLQKVEWCREVELAGLTGSGAFLDQLDRLQEEVANLSSEGLLRMGIGDSPVRYHAHGETLWPVYPNGMCRGCS